MARTARDLCQDAARTAGIIDAIEALESQEAAHALLELNNLLSQWDLDGLFPYTKVISNFTVPEVPVTSASGPTEYGSTIFTVGREIVINPGLADIGAVPLNITYTGLTEEINGSSTVVRLNNSIVKFLDDDSEAYFIPNESVIYNGIYVYDDGTILGQVEIANGAVQSFAGNPIPAGSTLTYSGGGTSTIDANGVFKYTDVFIKRPNIVKSLAQDIGSSLQPLKYVDPDSWDLSSATVNALGYAAYYTVRTDFPFLKVEYYPATSGKFKMTSEITTGDYLLDDEIELPSGYYAAIQYGLAEVLALHYGIENYPLIQQKAKEYLARVKKINQKSVQLATTGRPRGYYYDINSDTTTGRY